MTKYDHIKNHLLELGESESSQTRTPLNFLMEDKNYWSSFNHIIKGYEVSMDHCYFQGLSLLKVIHCPHCKMPGIIAYSKKRIGSQDKIWCRRCCKTSMYKYKR